MYIGDFQLGQVVRIKFTTTAKTSGAPVAPSSAFAAADFRIYKDGSATEKTSTNGITVTSPFDSVTGRHLVEIDTNNSTGDTGFWAAGSDYWVELNTAKTVDSESVSGLAVGGFSLDNRNANANVKRWRGGEPETLGSGLVKTDPQRIQGNQQAAEGLINLGVSFANDGVLPPGCIDAAAIADDALEGKGAGLTTAQAGQLSTIYDRAVAGTLPASPLPRAPGDDLEIVPGDAYTVDSPNGEIVFTLPAGSTTGDDGRLRIYWPGGSIDAASTVTDESGTKRLRFSLTEAQSGSIPIGADARYQVGTVEADKNWTPIDGPVVIPHRHES